MALSSALKGIGKAIPVIVAYAPTIAEIIRQLRAALKKPKPEPVADAGAPAA
jgi:hypothetical protein